MPAHRQTVTAQPAKQGSAPVKDVHKLAESLGEKPAQVDPSATVESKSVNVAQCEIKNENGNRRCQLDKGHEGDHKYRIVKNSQGAAVNFRDVVGADFSIEAADVEPGQEVVQVKEMTRDEDQQKFDAMVKVSHEAWVKAGKPAEFNKSPRKRVNVPSAAVPAIRGLLNRAGTFHSLNVRIAKPVIDENGMAAVYFVAVEIKKAEKKAAHEPHMETQRNDGKAPSKPELPAKNDAQRAAKAAAEAQAKSAGK